MRGKLAALMALAAAVLLWPASAIAAQVSGDFDGDGHGDLAVGVEGQTVNGHTQAGAVHVIYGSRHGLSGRGDRIFNQDTPGIKDTAEAGDRFGPVMAAGDFNGDGRSDLAIGVPFESVGATDGAGVVQILYGSPHGLRVKGNQRFVEGAGGLPGTPTTSAWFGFSLAAADFGHGKRDDLAIGASGQTVGSTAAAGAVYVLYGSRGGLSSKGTRLWSQDSPGIKDVAESGDQLGWSLAAGDLGRDGHADLAIGVYAESVGTSNTAGAVNVIYGSRKGLRSKGNQFFTQDSPGIKDVAEPGDELGWSVAAANLGRDRHADLAIGAPLEGVGSVSGAGAVNVIYGSPRGLRAKGNQLWSQDTPGIKDAAETNDLWGSSLAAANFGHGGRADLAVGADAESVGSTAQAGAVSVIYGSRKGLRASGNQFWTQDTPGVPEAPESGDFFGWALAGGRFRGGRVSDLAIGVPGEGGGTVSQAGAVNVLRGSAGGLSTHGNQFLTEGSGGLAGSAENGDIFGAGLSDVESSLILA
jgi:hypothetical protein